jgi:hypothetical protein
MRKYKIIYLFIIKVLLYTILLLNIILSYLIFIISEYFQSQNIYYVTQYTGAILSIKVTSITKQLLYRYFQFGPEYVYPATYCVVEPSAG